MAFSLFKKKKGASPQEIKLTAFATGKAMALDTLGDGVFSAKMLGNGIYILPWEGRLVAPAAGEVVVVMADSGHAVGIDIGDGVQLLLHIGLETVNMGGQGFELLVAQGDKVAAGQPLINFDREAINAASCSDAVIMVIAEAGGLGDYQFSYPAEAVAGETEVGRIRLA